MDEKIEKKNKLLEKAIYTQQHWKWKLRLGGRARPPFVHSRQLCDRIQFLEAQLSNFRGCFVARRVSLCPTQLIKKRTHKKIICAKRQKNKKENKKSI